MRKCCGEYLRRSPVATCSYQEFAESIRAAVMMNRNPSQRLERLEEQLTPVEGPKVWQMILIDSDGPGRTARESRGPREGQQERMMQVD